MSQSFNADDDIDLTMSEHSDDFALAPASAQTKKPLSRTNSGSMLNRGNNSNNNAAASTNSAPVVAAAAAPTSTSSFAAALAPNQRPLADQLDLPAPPKSLMTRKELHQIAAQAQPSAPMTPAVMSSTTPSAAAPGAAGSASSGSTLAQRFAGPSPTTFASSSAPSTPSGVAAKPAMMKQPPSPSVSQSSQQQQQPQPQQKQKSATAAVAAANIATAAAVGGYSQMQQQQQQGGSSAAGGNNNNTRSASAVTSSSTNNTGASKKQNPNQSTASARSVASSQQKGTKGGSNNTNNSQSAARSTSAARSARSASAGGGGGASSVDSSLQSVPEGVDFLYRMGKLYDTYKQRLQAEKQKLEKQTMRNVPEISEFAHRLRHSEDTLTRLASTSVTRMRNHQKKREKERVAKIEKKETAELAECTFHPEIDEISKSKVRHGTVHEFNMEWLQRRDRRLEYERYKKMEKDFLESQPGPMLASAGKYADPDAAEERRHGLPIEDHLIEMGRQRERRLYEKVQTRLDGRSDSQHQAQHSRSGTPLGSNVSGSRSASAPNYASSVARSEASIAESVVARLYTPGKRPAVYDEEYVQNCTFQPRVYSTFEDPLGHLPAHERLRMRGGSDMSVRRHQKLVMEYDQELTGHPRLSGKSVEIIAQKRAEEEQNSLAVQNNNNASAASGGGLQEMRSPSQRLYQDSFARDERLLKLQAEADRERRKLGHPVTNTPLKKVARKAGARPPSIDRSGHAGGGGGSNANSRSGTPSRRIHDMSSITSSADIAERTAHWERKKEMRHANLKDEVRSAEEAELAECSFAPTINNSCSVPLKSTNQNFKARSKQWTQKRDRKLADLARERKAELEKQKADEERQIAELRSYTFKARPAPEPPVPEDVPLGYEKFIERQQKGHWMKKEKEEALDLRPGTGTMRTGLKDYASAARSRGRSNSIDGAGGDQQQQQQQYHRDPNSTLRTIPEEEREVGNIAHHYLVSPAAGDNNNGSNNIRRGGAPGQRMEQRIQHRHEMLERRGAGGGGMQPPTPLRPGTQDAQGTSVTPHRFSYMNNLRQQMFGVGGGTGGGGGGSSGDDTQAPAAASATANSMPQQFGVVEPDAAQYLDARHPHESPPRTNDERSFLTRTSIGGGLDRPMAPQLSPEAKQRQESEDRHDLELQMQQEMQRAAMQQQQQPQQQPQQQVTAGGRTFKPTRTSLTPTRQDRQDRIYVQNTNHAQHIHNTPSSANASASSASARGSLTRRGGSAGGTPNASTSSSAATARGGVSRNSSSSQNQRPAATARNDSSQRSSSYSAQDEAEGDAIQRRARALLNRSAAMAQRHGQQQEPEQQQQQQGGALPVERNMLAAPGTLPPPPLPPTAPLLHH